ncbi:MAG: glycosyltransferase [Bacteroidota bacterium]|jgi:glycosyltransferase involved in cell wall biosynthesis|nr:glycosyltransferase [Ignavibacteria bacterium]MCU7498921.1 glycosyltransferase [Ignavibacteria bacterium]MCU7513938.1 glycosyltransferase [Ignavibacteria bacterium]MCU7521366.1 glycosyltransferase [Ignavibacteria bacterium]MCU7524188.1 glycosyltransferase [Ignavibacteria bacterium]
MVKASVIISFYARIDYLRLLFAGFERQTFKDFEIIIADDGSKEDVTLEIERLSAGASFPVVHLWHEDKGFRKNKILNSAISASASDYLIFVDGDCVPHRKFVEEHFINRQERACLAGRRVNLSEKITKMLSYHSVKDGFLERKLPILIFDGIFGKSFDVEKGFYFESESLRRFFNKKKRGIVGCNFSLHKKDFLSINGFDERYEKPSIGEDSDVQFRLELQGVEIKSINHMAVQYHLYHVLQARPEENLELFRKIKESKESFTPFGILRQESKI